MNLNSYSAESPFSRKDLMAGGALLAFYLITRITHLTVLPVFNDEAVYLHWAKLIEEDSGNLWISIEADSKKPLLIWLLVLGFKLFHDPLWAGRMVSVAAGMGSLVGIYLVGCRYHSRRVGQLGALLFVFSPYHLFFDRMVYEAALIDCFFIWSLWLTLSLVRGETQGSLFLYVGLAVVTGLGLLTQSVAVLFVFLPLLITWIYSGEKKILPWTMALPIYGSGIGLGALPYGILYFTVEKFPIKNYFIPTTHNLGKMGMLDLLAGIPVKLYGGVDELLGYFFHYLTWPVFLSATVYFFWQFMKFERRDFILLIYFLLPAIILVGTAGKGFSRYYLFCATPLLLWAARTLDLVWNLLQKLFIRKLVNRVFPVLFCVLIVPAANFDYRLLTQPEKAPFIDIDRYQYISSRFSGYGIPQAVRFFLEVAREKKVTLFTSRAWGNPADAMQTYLADHPNINVYMAYWMYERTLLPDEVEMIAMRQPFTKKILREVRTQDLGEVYFIWRTSPKFSRKEFFEINPNFQMIKAFKKPGSTNFVEIYKLREKAGSGKELDQ